jgi:signal transduction histidine kinase
MQSPYPRSRSTVIVVLLVATLGMTAMLAYEAQQAARSHRATAENVLREYAGFAAWELSRLGRAQLMTLVHNELSTVQRSAAGGRLQDVLERPHTCGTCGGDGHRVRSAFRAALPAGEFEFAGEPVDPKIRALLARTVADAVRAPNEFTCPALRVVRSGPSQSVVVWRPVLDHRDNPTGIVGFVSDVHFVESVFAKLLKHTALLPPSLMADSKNPNSELVVRIATGDGDKIFASAGEWSAYAAEQTMQSDLGALKLSVALKPEAAGRLVIGGLPRERLPLVVGLLTLTAGLVVVALVQLRREAELSRLRSDFVSGVSHELRTPLAQIRMFSETLLLGRVRSETEGRRSLEIIARETQRLTQLVENVLFFSRGERHRPTLARESTRLASIVADVVESFAPLAAARRAHVSTRLDDGVAASVDAGAMRQILLNLLDNAVKYGPAGQTVSVRLELIDDRARLTVEDEGPGIDSTDAERVWEPFHRLAGAAEATGGTGIGLAIVRQLTDLHGGRAWVERGSTGARFVVEIPGAWAEPAASIAVA